MEESTKSFRQRCVEIAVEKAFNKSFFSVCDIDQCLVAIGIRIDQEDHASLRAIHTTDFAEMDDGFRSELARKVRDLLQLDDAFEQRMIQKMSMHARAGKEPN